MLPDHEIESTVVAEDLESDSSDEEESSDEEKLQRRPAMAALQ